MNVENTLPITQTPVAEPLSVVARPTWRSIAARLWPVNGAAQEIAALDGLRALAVILTIVNHLFAALWQSHATGHTAFTILDATKGFWEVGSTGVQLFFVLSGFLLFMPYARTILGLKGYPDTRKFYIRRALRILPAYWVSLALIVLLFEPDYLKPANWYNVGMHALLIHNWSSTTRDAINGPFWTMAIESQFYLFLPLIAFGLWRAAQSGRRRVVVGIFAALGGVALAYGLGFAFFGGKIAYIWGALEPLKYMVVFGVGMAISLLYIAVTEKPDVAPNRAQVRRLVWAAAIAGAVCFGIYTLIMGLAPQNVIDVFYHGFGNTFLAVAYGGLLLVTLLSGSGLARILATPALRFIGIISYSLYIWNWLFFDRILTPFAQQFGSDLWTLVLDALGTLVLTIPFCFAFYHIIERPFIRARRIQH